MSKIEVVNYTARAYDDEVNNARNKIGKILKENNKEWIVRRDGFYFLEVCTRNWFLRERILYVTLDAPLCITVYKHWNLEIAKQLAAALGIQRIHVGCRTLYP